MIEMKKKIIFWVVGIAIVLILIFLVPIDFGYLGKGTIWDLIKYQIL